MTIDAAALTVTRRALIGGGIALLTGCTQYSAALPIPACDYVQVAIDLRRHPSLRVAPPASGAPTSEYCRGQPQHCSSTHVRDIRDSRAVATLADFVNARLEGWYEPMAGVPIPEIEIFFRRGEKTVATFGSGSSFFSRGGFPSQKIITAAAAEIATFHSLAHIR